MGRLRQILVGVLAAGVLAGCVATTPSIYVANVPGQESFIAQAWEDTCRLSNYSCDGIEPPLVRWSKYATQQGVWGMYLGGNEVYMADTMKIEKRKSQAYLVLVHEMHHYLEQQVVQNPNSRTAVCLSEEQAFSIDGALARELGLPELDRSKTWLKSYGHCQPSPWGNKPEETGEE